MSGTLWSTDVTIRFSHCDPARIVYFASHFDILNGVIEDWFINALALSYYDIIGKRQIGLGYAHSSCEFRLPARMGDVLTYAVRVERVGTKSLPLHITARRGAEEILEAKLVIVSTDLVKGNAIPLPDDIRAAAIAYWEQSA